MDTNNTAKKYYDASTFDILALLDATGASDECDDNTFDGASDADAYDAPTMEDFGACPKRADKAVYERCVTGIYGRPVCKRCGQRV